VDPFSLRSFPMDQAGTYFKRVGFKIFTELVTSFAENYQNRPRIFKLNTQAFKYTLHVPAVVVKVTESVLKKLFFLEE
jgi:hypothetical protein